MADIWQGGCQCGGIRYEVESERIVTLYCCHCRECQRQSASVHGMSLIVPRDAFKLLAGNLKIWQRGTDTGNVNRGHFCPDCGVRIFHDGGERSDIISVKAGTLDDTSRLWPVGHIWLKRAQPWVAPPDDTLQRDGEPESDEPFIAAWRARHG